MPDPAPLTAEERNLVEWAARWIELDPRNPPAAPAAIRRLLSALDAAEARLADARRKAIEERDRIWCKALLPEGAAVINRVTAHMIVLRNAPRPTEETTP